jgi:mannosyltransferase
MAVSVQPRGRARGASRDASDYVPLAAMIALGALIRFATLNQQSFWFDEATTYGIVSHGLGHVLSTVPKSESTPPLYYLLVWVWSRVFGTGEVGLRSFSALCGTLTIPIMWAAGRRLLSARAGLIAGLLTAVNPLLFWYSQEARSYALLVLLCAASMLLLAAALERPSARRLAAWSAVSALALLTHYFAFFLVVPECLWLLVALHRRARLSRGGALAALGPVLVAGLALTPLAVHQADGRASFITESGSLPFRVGQLVKQDIIGDGQPEKALLTAIGCALVLAALALLALRADHDEHERALLPLAIGAGAVLLAVLVAATVSDYFDSRNMLATWPAPALVVAGGLGARRAGRAGVAVTAGLAVLGLVCVFNVVTNSRFQRDNWRGATQALGPATASRAIVSSAEAPVPLQVYLSRLTGYPANGAALSEVDVVWLGRRGYGDPLEPITPVALPGFTETVTRTSSYAVVRYRSPKPRSESPGALARLYPTQLESTLLQLP